MKAVSRFVIPLMLALLAGSGLAHASPMRHGHGGAIGHHEARMTGGDRTLFGCGLVDEARSQSARDAGGVDFARDMSLLDYSHTFSGVTAQ